MTQQLDPWIEGYLAYQADVRRLRPGSIRDIRCALKNVSVFMATHAPGRTLWQLKLPDYLAWINDERERGHSELTINKEVTHVRGFLDYSWRSGRTHHNVLDGFTLSDTAKKAKRPPRVLSLEEARRLVNACQSRTFAERCDRMIVLVLYGCGLRTFELCQLDVQDVDLEQREVFVKQGKGERQRRIPVPSGVWTELLAYLNERGGKRGALFKTQHKKRRVNAVYVGRVVRETALRAGIQGPVTPKTLRHSFGTHLADQRVDLAVIATLMGHRSPSQTSTYLHVLEGKKEEAVGKLRMGEGS